MAGKEQPRIAGRVAKSRCRFYGRIFGDVSTRGFATHPEKPVDTIDASQKASLTRISRRICSVLRMHFANGHKTNLRLEAAFPR